MPAVLFPSVLGGSLSWGTGSVLAGWLAAPARPLLGSAMEMLAGGIVLTALAAATGELSHLDPGHVSGRSLVALLYLIGPGSLLAMTCHVIALRRLPTATVSTYAYVNPVVAVGLGALLLGERLTLTTLLGGAVVLASVALLLSYRSRQGPVTFPAPAEAASCAADLPAAADRPAAFWGSVPSPPASASMFTSGFALFGITAGDIQHLAGRPVPITPAAAPSS